MLPDLTGNFRYTEQSDDHPTDYGWWFYWVDADPEDHNLKDPVEGDSFYFILTRDEDPISPETRDEPIYLDAGLYQSEIDEVRNSTFGPIVRLRDIEKASLDDPRTLGKLL